MSVNVGEAVGYLDLDTSKFRSGFQSAMTELRQFKNNSENTMNSLQSVSGAAFTSVGNSLTKFVTKPALLAGSALSGLTLGKGWSRMTQLDNARAKLEALGNSAETVEIITKNVGNVVEGTAYTSAQAMTAAASAVAAGIEPGKELERYLGLIGDAAAVAGTDFNEMGSIFNKVTATGKADAEIMNQLANRGIPIWSLLAKTTGKSMDEVRGAVSSGKISIEELQDAIEVGMGGAARTIGSKTITGAIENIGAYIGLLGQKFLGASDDSKSFAGQLLPVLNSLIGKIQDLTPKAEKMGQKFGTFFTNAVDFFSHIPASVGLFTGALLISAGPLLKLVGTILSAKNAVSAFSTATQGASVLTGVLNGQLTISQAIYGTMGGKLSTVASKVLTFASANKVLLASLGVVGLLAAFAVYLQQTGKTADEIAQDITDAANKIVEGIVQFTDQIPVLVQGFSQVVPVIVNALVSAVPAIIQAGITLFGALIQAIPQIVPTLVAALPQIISSLVSGLLSLSGMLLQVGIELLKSLWSGMKTYGPTLVTALVSWAKSIPKKIKSGLGSLVQIGKDWLQGLWNGMKSKFDSVLSWAKKQIAKLPAAFKKILGIGSPSKISRADGAFWIEGLRLGILSKTSGLLTSAKDQVKRLMDIYKTVDIGGTIPSFEVTSTGMTGLIPTRSQQFDYDKFSAIIETGNASLADTVHESIVEAMDSFVMKLDGREVGRVVRAIR